MSTEVFSNLPVGSRFFLNGVEYVKIDQVKVSCCKSINAHQSNNAGQRIFLAPTTQVNINA